MSWVDVDYDVEKWLWMPTSWGEGREFPDHRDWARTYAEAAWTLADVEPGDEDEVNNLALTLAVLAEEIPGRFPDQEVYLYLPDPRRMPLPLYVQLIPSEGARDARLREIVRADDDEAVEKPIVDLFATEHLGEGMRSLRYFIEPDEGALACSLNYAWRLQEHPYDLRLWTSTGDLGRLSVSLDDFDGLARSIRVRRREDT